MLFSYSILCIALGKRSGISVKGLRKFPSTEGRCSLCENRAFGMLVAGNSVNALQVCSIALVLLVIMT